MSQVLQDVADMAINFERSCGYSLPTFERSVCFIHKFQFFLQVQQADYKKHTTTISSTGKAQLLALLWRTLQKELSNSPEAKSPTKYKSTKEKQHNLIKTFRKKFQDRRQIDEICTPAGDSSEEFNNFISEFENIMLEDSYNSSS